MCESMSSEEQERCRKYEEALEVQSLRRIIGAFLNYPDAAEDDVKRWERSFNMLPPTHKALLSHLPHKYKSSRRCISANSVFILNMLQAFEPPLDMNLDADKSKDYSEGHYCHKGGHSCSILPTLTDGAVSESMTQHALCCSGGDDIGTSKEESDYQDGEFGRSGRGLLHREPVSHVFEHIEREGDALRTSNGNENPSSFYWMDPSLQLKVPLVDVDKVRCVIRNIVRDWASEGKAERDQCYKPILEELERLFPARSKNSPPCCLVPGAGLGRLALEISRLGFVCQGNEFSYYMMICSNFILNNTQRIGEWTLYPWIHSNCNSRSDEDQLRSVSIPDLLPARNHRRIFHVWWRFCRSLQ